MAGERYYQEVLELTVRPSARELDREMPGWPERVEWDQQLESLVIDMRSLTGCMLGQLWGTYVLGKEALRLNQDRAVQRGFCPMGMKLTPENLRRAWSQVAKERKERTKQWPQPLLAGMNYDEDYGWEIITGRATAVR